MFSNNKILFAFAGIAIIAGIFALIFFKPDIFKLAPKSPSADSLVMIEKLTPEIEQLSNQLKKDPRNAGLLFNRGNAYFNYGNMKYALDDYLKAYQIDSLNSAYVMGLADCFFEVNNAQGAIGVLETYLQHDPNNVDVLIDAGTDYFLLPTPAYQKAIDKFNAVLKININNADAYFYKGLIYEETKDTAKAISNFQTCVQADPGYYDAYMQLGLLYADKKNPLAVKYFDNAIALNDTSHEAQYAKAKFFQDQGKISDAIEYYKQMIQKDPQDADAIYNLATIYYGIDSVQKAYHFFDMAIKQSPEKAIAYYGKGLCAEYMKKTEEAISYYKQALNLDPELKDAEERLKKLNAE